MGIRTDRAPSRPSQGGFTLIELMIVVVIIGILAALAIPRFGRAATAAKQHEAHLILKQVYTLQSSYYNRHSHYAASLQDLEPLGWSTPENLNFFDPPAFTGGGSGSTTFSACMQSRYSDIPSRSIDQVGHMDDC